MGKEDPREAFDNDDDFVQWINQYIHRFQPEWVSPLANVDVDQHDHVDLL